MIIGQAELVTSCVKCGCGDAAVQWHRASRDGFIHTCGYYAKAHDAAEHLHLTCRRCGYEWIAPTLDTQKTR